MAKQSFVKIAFGWWLVGEALQMRMLVMVSASAILSRRHWCTPPPNKQQANKLQIPHQHDPKFRETRRFGVWDIKDEISAFSLSLSLSLSPSPSPSLMFFISHSVSWSHTSLRSLSSFPLYLFASIPLPFRPGFISSSLFVVYRCGLLVVQLWLWLLWWGCTQASEAVMRRAGELTSRQPLAGTAPVWVQWERGQELELLGCQCFVAEAVLSCYP